MITTHFEPNVTRSEHQILLIDCQVRLEFDSFGNIFFLVTVVMHASVQVVAGIITNKDISVLIMNLIRHSMPALVDANLCLMTGVSEKLKSCSYLFLQNKFRVKIM